MNKWYAESTKKKGVRQMAYRQSDGRIVPMKAGNPKGITAGGKSRTGRIPHSPSHAEQTQRGNISYTQKVDN